MAMCVRSVHENKIGIKAKTKQQRVQKVTSGRNISAPVITGTCVKNETFADN